MENVERIAKMEEILQEAKTVLTGLEAALEDYRNIEADIRILQEYFDSDAWMNDFEADEDGLLPADLKRGVLSEDEIYNLLENEAELLEEMRDLSAVSEDEE